MRLCKISSRHLNLAHFPVCGSTSISTEQQRAASGGPLVQPDLIFEQLSCHHLQSASIFSPQATSSFFLLSSSPSIPFRRQLRRLELALQVGRWDCRAISYLSFSSNPSTLHRKLQRASFHQSATISHVSHLSSIPCLTLVSLKRLRQLLIILSVFLPAYERISLSNWDCESCNSLTLHNKRLHRRHSIGEHIESTILTPTTQHVR